jgi:hypothetical protein
VNFTILTIKLHYEKFKTKTLFSLRENEKNFSVFLIARVEKKGNSRHIIIVINKKEAYRSFCSFAQPAPLVRTEQKGRPFHLSAFLISLSISPISISLSVAGSTLPVFC